MVWAASQHDLAPRSWKKRSASDGSTRPPATDLPTLDADVASIFGTRDGLTTLDDIDDSRPRLLPDTDFMSIEGGNHAQSGDYGSQAGDNPATISRADQQAQAVKATLRILNAAE
ncbi:MAG: alpha/beta hydrolase [Acidimicrobiales bacterium]